MEEIRTSSRTIVVKEPISHENTMTRVSNVFERQRTEPEVKGADSKHSTFSFNNQPMFNTLSRQGVMPFL